MTEIGAIRETKRGRFALYAAGEYLFSIDADTLADSGLCTGDVLDEAELDGLRQRSETRKAADQALRYLSLRAYGEQELYRKLLLKFDELSAAAAVAKMVELGLLDDAEYAARKAEAMAQRGKSPREIADKLRALGIDKALAGGAVDGLEIDGAAVALALVQKSYMDKLAAGGRDKVAAALARRGFSSGEIRQALAAALEELGGGVAPAQAHEPELEQDLAEAAPPWEGP